MVEGNSGFKLSIFLSFSALSFYKKKKKVIAINTEIRNIFSLKFLLTLLSILIYFY